MAPNSLYPSFVKIDYHSAYGSHVMTIPTLQWQATPNVNGAGAFTDWAASTRDADDMINQLVDLMAVFFKDDTTFDLYTIYNMTAPDADPNPVASKALGTAGSNSTTTWSKAVQTTFTFRTALFGIMKLVFLDAPSGGLFDRILSFDASPEAVAIRAALNSSSNGWAGRDGGRIDTLVQIAYTLNEKLRREYNMN